MLKLKKDKKQEIYDYVIARFERLKTVRDIYDKKVKKWIFNFNSLPDITEDVLSQIVVPYIWIQSYTIKPRITASIFNSKEFLEVNSRIKEYQNSERKIRDYLLFKLEETGFREKTRTAINLALAYPCAWHKVILDKKNNPIITNLDFFDVWCPYTWQNGRLDIFHRIETSMHNIKYYEKQGIYENADDVTESKIDREIPQLQSEITSYFLGITDDIVVDENEYAQTGALGKVELLEWWGKWDVNDDGLLEDIIVTIANRQVGIRIDENLYDGQHPFFPIRIIRNPSLVYGKPVAQVLDEPQKELNKVRRQRLDFNDLILKPPLKYNRTADIDWKTFFVAPDKFWPVDSPDDITWMQFPTPPQTSYAEENGLKQDGQQAVGGTDPLQGMSPGGRQTATGLSILTSEGATRIRDYVNDVAEDIIQEVRFVAYCLKKFKRDGEIIKRLNTQAWEKVTVSELSGDYAIELQISNILTNRELRLQLLMNLLNMIGNIPGVKAMELVRQILDMAEVKSPESILPAMDTEQKEGIVKKRNLEEQARIGQATATGEGRPEQEVIGSKPLVANVPNVIQDPVLELIKNMRGGQ